jgi:hypothetical protein
VPYYTYRGKKANVSLQIEKLQTDVGTPSPCTRQNFFIVINNTIISMTLYTPARRIPPEKTGDFHDGTHERLEKEVLLTNRKLSHKLLKLGEK